MHDLFKYVLKVVVYLQLFASRLTYDEAYSTTQCGKADAFLYNKRSPSLGERIKKYLPIKK